MRRTSKVLASVTVILAAMPILARAEASPTRLSAGEFAETWNEDDQRGYVGGGVYAGQMNARLTDASGAPISGRTISFELNAALGNCTAVTDANGRAGCGSNRGGYEATFAGDDVYAPSRAEGCLMTLTGTYNGCILSRGTLVGIWSE